MKLIKTKRLTLRLFSEDDAPMIAKHLNSKNMYDMTLSLPFPYTLEMAHDWITRHETWRNNGERFEWAIEHTQTKQLIGAVGLSYNKTHHHGELGYWIGEPYWNQGYASEASRAVIDWAFEDGGYHRIFARHFEFNPASQRVIEKSGLRHEGKQIEHVLKHGVYQTLDVYSIINPKGK